MPPGAFGLSSGTGMVVQHGLQQGLLTAVGSRLSRSELQRAGTAVLVLALNEGWAARDVQRLATILLVLVALICVLGEGGDQ
ncbi:hypothetical protein ADK55_12175 [Streptomyces sp. WM4235]|nr:hypothetical protein ADK55_12175 [Streptomyces sp. WM4235]